MSKSCCFIYLYKLFDKKDYCCIYMNLNIFDFYLLLYYLCMQVIDIVIYFDFMKIIEKLISMFSIFIDSL